MVSIETMLALVEPNRMAHSPSAGMKLTTDLQKKDEMKKKQKISRILVIDDDPIMLQLVEAMLVPEGYHVLTAANGWMGLELAEMSRGNVDLLLTDVVMPEMGGEDVALAFRRTYPATRVLFMSAYMKPSIEKYGDVFGGVEFIVKPFTVSKLRGKIKRMLT
ncbi:MAG: response regulator [Pseudomonadota bacterium]